MRCFQNALTAVVGKVSSLCCFSQTQQKITDGGADLVSILIGENVTNVEENRVEPTQKALEPSVPVRIVTLRLTNLSRTTKTGGELAKLPGSPHFSLPTNTAAPAHVRETHANLAARARARARAGARAKSRDLGQGQGPIVVPRPEGEKEHEW